MKQLLLIIAVVALVGCGSTKTTTQKAKSLLQQPNANGMAALFFKNQLELQLQAIRSLSKKKVTSPTILIGKEEMIRGNSGHNQPVLYVHAITHANDTPYRLTRNALAFRESYGALVSKGSKPKSLHHVRFLKADPRVVIFPLGTIDSPQVKALGVKPFTLAVKPFKFAKVFIMSRDGTSYGEVEYKITPALDGYVKMIRPFAGGFFSGKFNPVKGDFVFSQPGELLGIMANSKYCLVIQNTTPAAAIMFGKNDSDKVARVLDHMRKIVAAKTAELQ